MLRSLSVKNFALIEDAEIQFGQGFSVLTGETGAGKSIIIGALSMVLGDRASTDLIRTGSERAVLEAVFSVDDQIAGMLNEQGIAVAEEITIRREISAKGQNRCFVDDSLITNQSLKLIGDLLVDLHGQHEHQSLLRVATHQSFLDAYASLDNQAQDCAASYRRYLKLKRSLDRTEEEARTVKERRDVTEQQLNEILAVDPAIGEDEALSEQERIISAAEKLSTLTNRVYDALYESEDSIVGALAGIQKDFDSLKEIDSRFEPLVEQLNTVQITLDEIARWLSDYGSKISFDQEKLEALRARILAVQRLKKKHGSLEQVISVKEELRAGLQSADTIDNDIKELKASVAETVKEYLKIADNLATRRQAASPQLCADVIKSLKRLGMEAAGFEIKFMPINRASIDPITLPDGATETGCDKIEFLMTANAGEPLKPLAKIASGGEISRIMLALKSALARADKIPTLVFDEIDVGISGRIAQSVGEAMARLGKTHQVICITHLPQIAGYGDQHYAVEKHQSKQRATTIIRKLEGEEKVREIARLLGGHEITKAALENAKTLIHSEV